jgi:hypothetical protein
MPRDALYSSKKVRNVRFKTSRMAKETASESREEGRRTRGESGRRRRRRRRKKKRKRRRRREGVALSLAYPLLRLN